MLQSEYNAQQEVSVSRIQLRVQESLREQIEEQAAHIGLTLSEYVLGAITDRLQRDREASSRVELSSRSRDWFFEVLDNTEALPEDWAKAAKTAAQIDG